MLMTKLMDQRYTAKLLKIIGGTEDQDFIAAIDDNLKTAAEIKQGIRSTPPFWLMTLIPLDVRKAVIDLTQGNKEYERWVDSDVNRIRLLSLCLNLPADYLKNYFYFDFEDQAKKQGFVNKAGVEKTIREAFIAYNGLGGIGFKAPNDTTKLALVACGVNTDEARNVIGGAGAFRSRQIWVDPKKNRFGIKNIMRIINVKNT